MNGMPQVAIVGAGPYGLSIAAHLRARGIRFRIFGDPMYSWRLRMPAGMFLKSEGFASNLFDPGGSFTLQRFCAENGIDYGDMGRPVALDTLSAYGLAFQKRHVPDLEQKTVTQLAAVADGFRLRLDDGETLTVPRVVLATGINDYQHLPDSLAALPPEHLSHSSAHHDLGGFRGRNVAVIGAGASAIDLAGLLRQAGAEVTLVARRQSIDWTAPPLSLERSLWQRIRYPISGMTPGIRSRLYEDFPMLFRYLPLDTRQHIIKTFLGPAPPWWMKEQIVGRMPLVLGAAPTGAAIRSGRVHLRLAGSDGRERELVTDHVIAATGYKVDLRRLPFLDQALAAQLRSIAGVPSLSQNFESSVPGLYFVGLPAALTFGPLMRFMLGAGYTARRLASHLATARADRPAPGPAVTMGPARA